MEVVFSESLKNPGIAYIWLIPESAKRAQALKPDSSLADERRGLSWWCCSHIRDTNRSLLATFRSLFRKRETGERKIIIGMLILSILGSVRSSGSNGFLYTQKKFGWKMEDYTIFSSFQVLHIGLKMLVVMPALCYYLKVHDCMLSILGNLSSVEENLVFAFATKSWMMYFGSALSALSGSRSVPESSILSKCVPSTELGKVFTVFGALQTLADLATSSVMKQVYNLTIESFLGSSYCISAGLNGLSIVVMGVLFWLIVKNEQQFGPLGERESNKKQEAT